MQWFKHKTASHDDPDIADAEDLYGDFGYSGFFKICEIYGQEFNHLSEGWLNISQTFLKRKLHKSWTKVELLLNFFSERKRILYRAEYGRVYLKIPTFIELADNWAKRQLCSNSVATTAIEVEEEVEVEKKKKYIRKKEVFIPPAFEELETYCKENGYGNIALKIYNYYKAGNWKDASGKPVKSWKQKLQGVWFKPENQDQKSITEQLIEEGVVFNNG